MVREGKMAKVIACKKAKVKSPVPGYVQKPVTGVTIDGMTMARSIKIAGEVPAVSMKSGESGARGVLSVHIQKVVSEPAVSPAAVTPLKPSLSSLLVSSPPSAASSPLVVREDIPDRVDSALTLRQLFSEKTSLR